MMVVRQLFLSSGHEILVAVDKPDEGKPVEVGSLLRCGGLTWTVKAVVESKVPNTTGFELEGDAPVRPGMKLRRDVDPMSDEEYVFTQQRILMLAAFIRETDTAGFLQRIERMHAAGPIVDPSLYRDGVNRVEIIEQTARALASTMAKLPKVSDIKKAFGHDGDGG